MILAGRLTKVIITDESSGKREAHDDIKFKLEQRPDSPRLTLAIPIVEEKILEASVKDFLYIEESSVKDSVECFRLPALRKMLVMIIKDNASKELVAKIHQYLQTVLQSRSVVITSSDATDLKNALRNGNVNEAMRSAEKLAEAKAQVNLKLKLMTKEDMNAANRPPPVEPLRLKFSVETFDSGQENQAQQEIFVMPKTRVSELKELVQQETDVLVQNQFWFFNRNHLPDDYIFGQSNPMINQGDPLILYIAKPFD